MPLENSATLVATLTIGEPTQCGSVTDSVYAPNVTSDIEEIKNQIADLQKRMEIVAMKVECLPAIIIESFQRAFDDLRWDGQKFPLVVEFANGTDYSGNPQLGVNVDGKKVFEKISEVINGSVAARVNFAELEALRKRVEELEAEYAKDIQKRKDVAEKLMQDYSKSPGVVTQAP